MNERGEDCGKKVHNDPSTFIKSLMVHIYSEPRLHTNFNILFRF